MSIKPPTAVSDEESWQAFLPFLGDEMACLIFRCFLRRAAAILSTIDFSILLPPLPEDGNILLKCSTFRLLNASMAVLKMYNSTGDRVKKISFLDVLAKEKAFVYFTVQLICKIMDQYGDPVIQVWLQPATGFIGLIAWTLDAIDILNSQLEKQGLLVTLIKQLGQLPSRVINQLTEDENITQMIWLSVRILFQCASKSRRVCLLFSQCNCSQLLLPLQGVPDVEVRLLIKSLLCLISKHHQPGSRGSDNSPQLLTSIEITTLKQMLLRSHDVSEPEPEPFSFHGLSYKVLFSMIECLAKDQGNAALFAQEDIPSILAELTDIRECDEELARLIWTLMLVESQDDTAETRDDTALISGDTAGTRQEEVWDLDVQTEREADVEFVELLLNYVMRTALSIPLADGIRDLPDTIWFNIGESVLLLSLILNEASDSIQADIARSIVALPGACKAMYWSVYMGLQCGDDGVERSIMTNVMANLVKISMTLSDLSTDLAREMARSGYIHMFKCVLHAGAYFNTLSRNAMTEITCSLYSLLNLAYDPTNFPAFYFTEVIPDIIQYVNSPNTDLAITAKFTLSCLHMHLDCDQLMALKLNEKEIEYCVSTLAGALQSPSFKGDGFAAHEILQILTNLTHPSHSTIEAVCASMPTQKQKLIVVPDYFDQKYLEAAMELGKLCHSLVDHGLLQILEGMLREKVFPFSACRLLWHLLHHQGIKNIALGLCEILENFQEPSFNQDQFALYCCLWLLGKADKKDLDGYLKYAHGCYKFEAYSEAVVVCSEIIEGAEEKKHEELKHQAILLKGKAVFYNYQRKMQYLMEKKVTILRSDEKRLISECFNSMKEAINLLGFTLDNLYIDKEGSKLLDWAMMDCVRESNNLKLCSRCLLCRRHGVSLCKSHIFPRFMLKNVSKLREQTLESEENREQQEGIREKMFLFGLDKYQLKSAGECWLWLCCKRCEGIMTQNAENDFSQLFPSSGTVEYSSWLFNYCCTILFRTLSCVKFPRAFNDEEVYTAFLACRKHLLSLPVRNKGTSSTLSIGAPEYQLQLLSEISTKDLKPYIIITPPTMVFERSGGVLEEIKLPFAIPWLSPHRLLDGYKDLSGWSHFFVAYSDGMSILLKFQPSSECSLPSSCLVSPEQGTYSIPDKSDAVKFIPKGLWMLHHRSALKQTKDYSEVFQQIAPTAAKKIISAGNFLLLQEGNLLQPRPDINISEDQENEQEPCGIKSRETDIRYTSSTASSTNIGGNTSALTTTIDSTKNQGIPPVVPYRSMSDKPGINLLPSGFNIVRSLVDKIIELPKGHKILLHCVNENLSVFLAVGNSGRFLPDQPYIIYHLNDSERAYLDGSFVTTNDGEICFSQYLMEHSINSMFRTGVLKETQECARVLAANMLSDNGFHSLSLFVLYLRCRQALRGADDLPSLGTKCSTQGCWYCCNLCHCCMKKTLSISGATVKDKTGNDEYRFCSKKCMGMFCSDPEAMAKSMFAVDHRDQLLAGNFEGPSVLDVVKFYRKEGGQYNSIDFINLCLGDGSEGLARGEPYILCQYRSIDTQYCMLGFRITKDCVPLGVIWPHLVKDRDYESKFKPALNRLSLILNSCVSALKCPSVAKYLDTFLNS